MQIKITMNELRKAIKTAGSVNPHISDSGGISGGKDIISLDVRNPVFDRIEERAVFKIHRFESELFDSLSKERSLIAETLLRGQKLISEGNIGKAGDCFRRGLDLQEALVNKTAYGKSLIEGNALLNEGINAMTTLICGGSETAFNNANADLGVGTATPTSLAGTCTFTQWSAAVTGSGTSFTTALAVGDWIRATTSTVWYRVKTITNNTNLVLEKAFEEATESGVTGYRTNVSLTDLQGTVVYKAMDVGYPTFGSGQNMIFQSVFGSADANQAWENFGVRNGATAAKNLNLRYSSQGTKTSGQTWTLNLQIDLA